MNIRVAICKKNVCVAMPFPYCLKLNVFFLPFLGFPFLSSLPTDTRFAFHPHACLNRIAISFARQVDRCLSKLSSRYVVTGITLKSTVSFSVSLSRSENHCRRCDRIREEPARCDNPDDVLPLRLCAHGPSDLHGGPHAKVYKKLSRGRLLG